VRGSLCYQLPASARGGIHGRRALSSPSWKISAHLRGQAFAAQRIHPDVTAPTRRAVSSVPLEGELDFPFHRARALKGPRFPDMLARRKPSLCDRLGALPLPVGATTFGPTTCMLGHRLPSCVRRCRRADTTPPRLCMTTSSPSESSSPRRASSTCFDVRIRCRVSSRSSRPSALM